MGLMQAIELVKDRKTKEPAPQETNRVMDEARNRGLLIGKGGLYGNVLRTSPPLNINKADVDEAIRILDEAFTAVEKQGGRPAGSRVGDAPRPLSFRNKESLFTPRTSLALCDLCAEK